MYNYWWWKTSKYKMSIKQYWFNSVHIVLILLHLLIKYDKKDNIFKNNFIKLFCNIRGITCYKSGTWYKYILLSTLY